MKKIRALTVVFLFLVNLAVAAAPLKVLSKSHPVKSMQWGAVPVSYVKGYLDRIKPELAKKFSPKLVEDIAEHCDPACYPVAWKTYSREELKIYAVGDFKSPSGDEIEVLWIPRAGNEKLWVDDYHLESYDIFVLVPKATVIF